MSGWRRHWLCVSLCGADRCLWLFEWRAFRAANAAAFVIVRGFGLACLPWLNIGSDICLLGQWCCPWLIWIRA